MKRPTRVAVLVLIIVACVGCDQSTKILALRHFGDSVPIRYLADTVRLQYVENTGAFLSLGANLPAWARVAAFVVLVGIVLAMVLVHVVISRRVSVTETVAAALLIGGGVGNLIDRAWLGYVRDFANLGIGPLRTGIFNVADVAIMAAAAIFLWHVAAERRKRRPAR